MNVAIAEESMAAWQPEQQEQLGILSVTAGPCSQQRTATMP